MRKLDPYLPIQGSVRAFIFGPDGRRLTSETSDGICTWNWQSGDQTSPSVIQHTKPVISSDGERLLTSGVNGDVRVWTMPREVGFVKSVQLRASGGYGLTVPISAALDTQRVLIYEKKDWRSSIPILERTSIRTLIAIVQTHATED